MSKTVLLPVFAKTSEFSFNWIISTLLKNNQNMISSIFGILEEVRNHVPVLDSRYALLMTLGKGRYARVKLAFDKATCKHVAIKMVPKEFTELQITLLLNEVNSLSMLTHSKLASILDFNFYGEVSSKQSNSYKTAYYVMDLAENGEFFHYIEKTGSFSEEMTRKMFSQLLRTVLAVHEQDFVHRDIKCENLLLTKDYTLKLCDFGANSRMDRSSNLCSDDISCPLGAIGSPEFNAPEILAGEPLTDARSLELSDVFSLGCVLFLMVFGLLIEVVNSMPFGCASLQDKYYKRLVGNPQKYWKIYDKYGVKYSDEFKDLFEQMTNINASKRISIKEIIEHPWLQGYMPPESSFSIEMKSRTKIVKEHFKALAFTRVQKFKLLLLKKQKECCNIPELSDSLAYYLDKIRPKVDRIHQLLHSDLHSNNSSSDSSSMQDIPEPAKFTRGKNLGPFCNSKDYGDLNPHNSDSDE